MKVWIMQSLPYTGKDENSNFMWFRAFETRESAIEKITKMKFYGVDKIVLERSKPDYLKFYLADEDDYFIDDFYVRQIEVE